MRMKLGGHLYTNTLRRLFYFFGAHFAACASALRLGQLEDDHGGSRDAFSSKEVQQLSQVELHRSNIDLMGSIFKSNFQWGSSVVINKRRDAIKAST